MDAQSTGVMSAAWPFTSLKPPYERTYWASVNTLLTLLWLIHSKKSKTRTLNGRAQKMPAEDLLPIQTSMCAMKSARVIVLF